MSSDFHEDREVNGMPDPIPTNSDAGLGDVPRLSGPKYASQHADSADVVDTNANNPIQKSVPADLSDMDDDTYDVQLAEPAASHVTSQCETEQVVEDMSDCDTQRVGDSDPLMQGDGVPRSHDLVRDRTSTDLRLASTSKLSEPETPMHTQDGIDTEGELASSSTSSWSAVEPDSGIQSASQTGSARQHSLPLIYGELVVLGYNGSLSQGDKGRKRSKFKLCRKQQASGVKPSGKHTVQNASCSQAVRDRRQHSVSYTLSRHETVIVEYGRDEETDMFQIGRSSEAPIDFVVMDTIPGCERVMDSSITQSTISRFACRIIVERHPPFTARIYAAGFNSERNIFLGEKATKWHSADGSIDGLTTNGVLIMNPIGGFDSTAKPGIWHEVSVGGGIYSLRESRSLAHQTLPVRLENNILQNGTLIDLCGATLLWRSASSLLHSPSPRDLELHIRRMNAARPQCPVGLNTLVLPHKNTASDRDRRPYAYLNCGHVHGQHAWGKKGDADRDDRTCPMCMTVGPFVQLSTGSEPAFYVEDSYPTYCFSPCAHVASEETVKYWSRIPIPHGCHGFRAACPFCATPLDGDPGYVRLIFQDNLD